MGWTMRPYVLLAAAVVVGSSVPAFAGYTFTTNADTFNNTDTPPSGRSVGDLFAVNAGTFAAYAPDTAQDPQMGQFDVPNYGYTLNATVTSIEGQRVNYTGTYEIFFNFSETDTRDPGDVRISAGAFAASATFAGNGLFTNLSGTLTQTQGPASPTFPDYFARYGNNPIELAATYVANPGGATGTLTSTFRQNAVVPEPAAAGLLGVGAVGLLARRRPRAARCARR